MNLKVLQRFSAIIIASSIILSIAKISLALDHLSFETVQPVEHFAKAGTTVPLFAGTTATIDDDFYFGVGDVRLIGLAVSGVPEPYRGTVITYTVPSNPNLSYRTGTGTYTDTLNINVSISSSGSGGASFFAFATAHTSGIMDFTITSSNTAAAPNIDKDYAVARVTQLGFHKLYLQPEYGYDVLTDNPNIGGGKRIFTDRDDPVESTYYQPNQIGVMAHMEPELPGVYFGFRAYDVDDPSSDATPVDDNGTAGNDNRQPVDMGVESVLKPASAYITNVRTISKQPGDNYKFVARCSFAPVVPGSSAYNALNSMSVTGTDFSFVPIGVKVSPMLTVWRRLHIERDSMGPVTGNYVTGNVQGSTTRSLKVNIHGSLPVNRFENGMIYLTHPTNPFQVQVLKVRSNDEDDIVIDGLVPGGITGWNFGLYDDDDFNSDDTGHLNGDNGEDIPAPDLSLLQDSDDPARNKLAPAYIRPTYDLSGENTNVPFVANTPDSDLATREPGIADFESMFRFDNIATENDPDFWTIYALNAYQDTSPCDLDPLTEGTVGRCGPLGRNDDFFGQGFAIFVESIHDYHSYLISTGTPISDQRKANAIALNEVGNLFGASDGEGGIMNDDVPCTADCLDFSLVTLDKIRRATHP